MEPLGIRPDPFADCFLQIDVARLDEAVRLLLHNAVRSAGLTTFFFLTQTAFGCHWQIVSTPADGTITVSLSHDPASPPSKIAEVIDNYYYNYLLIYLYFLLLFLLRNCKVPPCRFIGLLVVQFF